MKSKPHEDPNCKCKACEAWAAMECKLIESWSREMDAQIAHLNREWVLLYYAVETP